MPDSPPLTGTLDVPGARLYCERRGAGPLLLMIGSPMDSTGFAGLASALAGGYTVVTYDPRGTGNSSRDDSTADVTPEQQGGGTLEEQGVASFHDWFAHVLAALEAKTGQLAHG